MLLEGMARSPFQPSPRTGEATTNASAGRSRRHGARSTDGPASLDLNGAFGCWPSTWSSCQPRPAWGLGRVPPAAGFVFL